MIRRLPLLLNLLGLLLPVATQEAAQALPDCAASCLLPALANSSCPSTDLACLCSDAIFQSSAERCVVQKCQIKDALVAKNVTETSCHAPRRDESGTLMITTVALSVISKFLVGVRLGYKVYTAHGVFLAKPFSPDDWAIFAAVLIGIASNIVQVQGTIANGLGKDIWTLTPGMITQLTKFYLVIEVLYVLELAVSKLSIILFYLPIFPDPVVRRLLWGTLVFIVGSGIAFTFLVAFQCLPVPYFWLQWDGEHNGMCLNTNSLAWAIAVANIGLDMWMLAIPLSHLRVLKLSWRRKLGVGLMFGLGAFVTVVSIIRLRSLLMFSNSSNPTWDNLATSYWSTVEIDVGIICACMPALRLVVLRIFPGLRTKDDALFDDHTIWPNSRQRTPEIGKNSLGPHFSHIELEPTETSLRKYGAIRKLGDAESSMVALKANGGPEHDNDQKIMNGWI